MQSPVNFLRNRTICMSSSALQRRWAVDYRIFLFLKTVQQFFQEIENNEASRLVLKIFGPWRILRCDPKMDFEKCDFPLDFHWFSIEKGLFEKNQKIGKMENRNMYVCMRKYTIAGRCVAGQSISWEPEPIRQLPIHSAHIAGWWSAPETAAETLGPIQRRPKGRDQKKDNFPCH